MFEINPVVPRVPLQPPAHGWRGVRPLVFRVAASLSIASATWAMFPEVAHAFPGCACG